MEKQFEQILKEQVVLEFHKRGLDNLIVFFMAKYPNYPYTELEPAQIDLKYLSVYEIPFLASYIRYSDIALLGSGMRDEGVKEKLIFLYQHIGSILPSYRNFIWSDEITLEDLKRWLPIFSDFKIKNRIMKCTKITVGLKKFIDLCLDVNSFAYQNLVLLDELYGETMFEVDEVAEITNQEAFYKFLKVIKTSHLGIPFYLLLNQFWKVQKLIELFSVEQISEHRLMITTYLREFSDPPIYDIKTFEQFCKRKDDEYKTFLETEYDLNSLKEFYCGVFLGVTASEFQTLFPMIPNDQSTPYELLKNLYEAKFPLFLKENLYQRFQKIGDLKSYIEVFVSKKHCIEQLKLRQNLLFVDHNQPLVTLQNSKFCFVTSTVEEYQKKEDTLNSTIQTDSCFSYQEGCFIAYLNPTILSCHEMACTISRKDLVPEFLIAFDIVSFEHLKYRKMTNLPIVIIDTEEYVTKMVNHLEMLFDAQDWNSYIKEKRNLFVSIKNHPWLFSKYFSLDSLYEDVKVLQQKLEEWILEGVPTSFLRIQFGFVEQLISLNEELEVMVTKEKKTSFQYRKKMIQYDK